MTTTDFHHASLSAFEAREAKAQEPIVIDPTFFVTTLEWEQHCADLTELGEMVAAAVKENLAYKVESCPF